jgi:hypothetical protein
LAFIIKFPCGTQFIFRSWMFVAGENGDLELRTGGAVPKHLAPVYGQAPYYLANPYTSSGACSSMNPYVGPYYLAAMTSQGILIRATIYQPSAGASGSYTSGASPDRDSTEDYPEIEGSCYWNPVVEGHFIGMVAPVPSGNSSSVG